MRRTTLLSGRVFRLTPQSGIIRSILQSGSTKFSKLYHLNINLAIRKKKTRSILQNHKIKKERRHQVKSLIKLYHQKEK
jgi:hypothetical protein